jgi:hypothetical protein
MPNDEIFETYIDQGSGGRTFGLEALFPQAGIYSATGQKYEPVDADMLLSYKESTSGQILEEGISEAGAMGSFIAAGSAYATHGLNTIPFFFFYSMFGFQRVGDLIWAADDQRTRGFLVGATSGRTTLNGEGLQHEDGHSHLLAYTNPNVRAYDPCFAHELAAIVRHGMRQMYVEGEDVMYYITVANEDFEHSAMETVDQEGIIQGMYRFRESRPTGPSASRRRSKGLVEIATELSQKAGQARARKLSREELRGASFSITNLGGLGTTRFIPIVQWPQVAILSVGRLDTKPVWDGDEFNPRKIWPLGSTYDPRALEFDGRPRTRRTARAASGRWRRLYWSRDGDCVRGAWQRGDPYLPQR